MRIREETDADDRLVGLLTAAYTMLAMAPHDNWGHEGTPGEMAAYVVKTAKKNGNLGFLRELMGVASGDR